jgi:outer membrane protein
MKNWLAMAAFLGLAGLSAARAQSPDAAAESPSVPPPLVAQAPLNLPPESSWRLGVALGYGRRTNPLIQSDDIPVVVDVDIAWFGKRWFFDNGDVGFALIDRPLFTTNLVARVNSDRAFFSKTNKELVTFTQLGGGEQVPATDPDTGIPLARPVELKPPKRDYAIEAGVEVLLDGEWGQSTLRAFHDVSNTHDGYEISADYSYRWTRGRLSLAPSVGVAYKSASLNNYYWGVHKGEATFVLPEYHVDAGVGWEAGLRTSYYLTKSIRLAVSANYERLQHSVAQSPLVDQRYVFAYFAGLGWRF